GLTWISTGQLDVAKRVLRRTVELLREPVRAGLPVVVLEPSCAAVFRADAPELLPDDPDVRRLADATMTLAECLRRYAPDWQPPRIGRRAIVQTHCHQHAVLGTDADAALLRAAHVDARALDSGCCGLAGNFGFEVGHYDVSLACAERVLLPAVRGADRDTVVLADGFSCRTQIDQADTGRRAVHSAELLALGLRGHLDGRTVDELVERPVSSPWAARAVVAAAVAAGALTAGRGLRLPSSGRSSS
ncbi:MAG: (Fe-S)-binding protein, partial [Mycobacteriales bacterium]